MANPDDRLIPIESPVGETYPLLGKEEDDESLNLLGLCTVPRAMFNVIALGFIFMLLFTAFAPSQVRALDFVEARNRHDVVFSALTCFCSFSHLLAHLPSF